MNARPSDPEIDPELAALLHTWLTGWSASRGLAAPVDDGPGWRVEVGWPDQARRHVMPSVGAALRGLGESVVQPWVYLKALATVDAMRAALPARWTVGAPRFFMRFEGAPPAPRPLPAGYSLVSGPDAAQPAVSHVRILDAAGALAADGRVVLVGDDAIIDRIGTEAAHRRRGLGHAVMAALHAQAQARGAARGLLAATEAGRALYETLGWRVVAPYASAVIESDPVATASLPIEFTQP